MSSDCEADISDYDIGEDCSDDNVDFCEFPSCPSDNADCDVENDCTDEIYYGSSDNPENEVDNDYSADVIDSDEIQNSSADNEESDIENESGNVFPIDMLYPPLSNSSSNDEEICTQVLTLDSICRECISENFERFNTAYNTSTDPDLQRNLKILQKLYSSHLVSEMSKYGYLDRQYLKFAVNEYSKELDVSLLTSDCSYDSIINRMSEVGHSFLKVSFDGISYGTAQEITTFMNSVIKLLPNVNVLHLGSYTNDETLKIISTTCMDLKELKIDNSSVTVEGLKWLHQCTNLNEISLHGIKGIEEGVKFLLKNLPALEDIHYPNVPEVIFSMHEQDLKNNCLDSAQTYSLTKLNLTHTNLGLSLFVKVCPQIKTLSMKITSLEDLNLITSFSKLEKLSCEACIDGLPFPDFDSFLTASGKGIQELNVSCVSLSTCVLMEMCTKLKALYLREISFRMTGKETIGRKLNNLKMLYICDIDFSKSSNEQSFVMLLNSSPNLKELYIKSCECNRYSEFISKFCEKSSVERITFGSCDVEEPLLISILLGSPALNELYIEDCNKIGHEEIERLESVALSSKNRAEIIWLDDLSQFYVPSEDSFEDQYDDLYDYDYEYTGSDDDWYPGYDADDPDYDFHDL